jgi:hypothetical protein
MAKQTEIHKTRTTCDFHAELVRICEAAVVVRRMAFSGMQGLDAG